MLRASTNIQLSIILFTFIAIAPHTIKAQDDYNVVSSFENLVLSKCKDVTDNCKIVNKISKFDLVDLPLGITPGCNSGTVIIVVDSAYRKLNGGQFFSAYASVVIPGTSRPIAFAAKNIAFGKGGLKRSNRVKMTLVTTHQQKIGEHLTLELPADGHNYIEFDCEGFKAINLKGNFIFEDILTPATDLAPSAKSVTASFEINTHDLNDIMATVNITPFMVKGLEGVSFQVRDASVDFSDIANPPGFTFPAQYVQTFGTDMNLWRGFFLKDLTVQIKSLSDSTSKNNTITLSAKNMIIDDLGLSGDFSGTNLISLSDGSAGGWSFSVEKLTARLELNRLTAGSLDGHIGIPFLGDEPAQYGAMLEQQDGNLNFRFLVAIPEMKEFNGPLKSIIQINKGSTISIEKKHRGKLTASALLHGKITVKEKLNANGIAFENLGLTTAKPYIAGGEFSTIGEGQSKAFGSFPVQIDDLRLRIGNGEVALTFDLTLNLMNKEDKSFSATTRLDIFAKMEIEQSPGSIEGPFAAPAPKHKWKFNGVKVKEVAIDCSSMAFTLKGIIAVFENDTIYGTGFHGSLDFKLKQVLEKPFKVNAYFGSTDGFRYWHFDVTVPVGKIPLVPPVLLTGIMGGASYKMVRKDVLQQDFSGIGDADNPAPNRPPVYVPDGNVGLGLLAGVCMVVGTEGAVNADAMFEVMFNQGGGLKYVLFEGSAFFLTPIKSRARMKNNETPESSVYAKLNMLFDNDNGSFHANLKTYIDFKGLIKGIHENGLVGEAVIHVDKRDWYLYIGRPSAMFGLSILGLATAKTYFMVGTKIENMPLPPPEVREIFGKMDLSMMRNDDLSAGGKGFAVGVHFKVGFDSENDLMPFYIMISVGAGADVMVRNFGNAECAGRDGQIGINGWYATGQAYVFLVGKVGLRFKKKTFDIVSIGLAAILQASLPNPSWMRGALAGKYKILGGLIKGNFNLSFELGEKCQIVSKGGEIADIEIIEELTPNDKSTNISVFTGPQVSFNASIDRDFSMMDFQSELHSYKIILDEYILKKGGTQIPAEIQWNAAKDVAALKTHEILPPNSDLTVSVKIHWEKKTNGKWSAIKDDNDHIIFESKETHFLTSEAPNYIPEENVLYSWPVKNQQNMYTGESKVGYVKLNYSQVYLFEDSTMKYKYIAQFADNRGNVMEVPLTYDASQAQANLTFPALEKQTIYTMKFVKMPETVGDVDQNVQRNTVVVAKSKDEETTVEMASNSLDGNIAQDVNKDIYNTAFRVSQFSTFSDKWNAMSNGTDAFDIAYGNVAVIGRKLTTQEVFDEVELVGTMDRSRLIDLIAAENNTWLQDSIKPLLYEYYPYENGMEIDWREPEELGIVPLKGVGIYTEPQITKLTDGNISSGKVPPSDGRVMMKYMVSFYSYWDYNDLINKANKYVDVLMRPRGVDRLLKAGGYRDLVVKDSYNIDVKFTLPGATRPNFNTSIEINFPKGK